MLKILEWAGNISGILGILVCVVAGLARLVGQYYIVNFEIVTLVIGGTALMVMACLFKLQSLYIQMGLKANF